MRKDFEDILDACLDRITLKGDSIEQCLESYPEQAAELEPLLRGALSIKEVSSIEARPEFRRVAKSRLLSALAAKEKERRRQPLWVWQRRWALAIALVLALFIAGGGTVMAASNSLPGDTLYPMKMATEKVQAFFTFGDEAKANLHMKFAERRANEIESLTEMGRDIPQSVLNAMDDEINRVIRLVDRNRGVAEKLAVRLETLADGQRMVLKRAIERFSQQPELRVREALERALERSEDAYREAVRLRYKMLRDRLPKLEIPRMIPWGNGGGPAELGASQAIERAGGRHSTL